MRKETKCTIFFCELIKEANQIRGIEADGEDTSNQFC